MALASVSAGHARFEELVMSKNIEDALERIVRMSDQELRQIVLARVLAARLATPSSPPEKLAP